MSRPVEIAQRRMIKTLSKFGSVQVLTTGTRPDCVSLECETRFGVPIKVLMVGDFVSDVKALGVSHRSPQMAFNAIEREARLRMSVPAA